MRYTLINFPFLFSAALVDWLIADHVEHIIRRSEIEQISTELSSVVATHMNGSWLDSLF
jgi:hypothetical protein